MSTNQIPSDSFATILDYEFSATVPNEEYIILRALKRLHPGENTRHIALIDRTSTSFPLSAYLHSRGVNIEIANEPKHEVVIWNAKAGAGSAAGMGPDVLQLGAEKAAQEKGELITKMLTGSLKFTYEGKEFVAYKCSWYGRTNMSQTTLYDIVFDQLDDGNMTVEREDASTVGHKLISDVYRWEGSLKDEMRVFQDGIWLKDKALWSAIRDASWDDLVLEEIFLENLRRDTRTFFENRQTYKDLGIAWKRGILLLGPPGNGKTESIKVLLKESGHSALYVKSFTTRSGPEHGVRQIFDHARANAPCILVIEDLDSLVNQSVRSFFLNELDGLAQNEGILTIATTNHPELIDDAILNRPSRFDVKYTFDLPTEALRISYAHKWIRKFRSLQQGAKIAIEFAKSDAELAEEVAKGTDGWSFAFLKELFVSFLLRVAHDRARLSAERTGTKEAESPADSILIAQIDSLSSQVQPGGKNESDEGVASGPSDKMQTRIAQPILRATRNRPTYHAGSNF